MAALARTYFCILFRMHVYELFMLVLVPCYYTQGHLHIYNQYICKYVYCIYIMYNAYTVYNPMQTLRIMHACIFHEIYYVLLTTVDLLAISTNKACSMCSGTQLLKLSDKIACSQALENTV